MRLQTTKKPIALLLYATIFLYSHTALATQTLPKFNATYSVEKYGIKVAEAHYQLSYTQTGYKFEQNTKLHGLASLFSNDTVSATSFIDNIDGNLLLTNHKYIQTGKEKNRNEAFEIDWKINKSSLKGEISGIVRNKKIDLQTNSKIWEAFSFQIPLMIEADINTKEYPYKAILKGEINTYNFTLQSTKKVSYAGNDYQALQLVREDIKRKKQLHIWLIPELNNIPIAIETYRKGKEDTRMQLESVQFNNDKALIAITINPEDDDDF